MTANNPLGRHDQLPPLVPWRVKANLTLALLGAAVLGCWHLALVLTVDGLDLGDVAVTLRALFTGHPLTIPGAQTASTATIVAVFGVLALVVTALWLALTFAWYGWRRRRRRGKGLALRRDVRHALGEDRARARASQARPGLSRRERNRADVNDIGLQIGTEVQSQEPAVVGLEDHLAVVGPTGAGKGASVMIPAALSAPGALVVTSTRTDILDVVARTRQAHGRLWVFDPMQRSYWPDPMVWDPVAGCEDGDRALSRAAAFAAGMTTDDSHSGTNTRFFQETATTALKVMLHAAALGGRSIEDVLDWAINLSNGAEAPQNIIRDSRDPRAETSWAGMLATVATGADETVASSRATLAQVIKPLSLKRILAWVRPSGDVPRFDAEAFVRSSDTLFLLSDGNAATDVGPLCTMVLQEVLDAGKGWAPLAPGGRIDPPVRIVGDELCNVAPLPKLPELVADSRAYGFQWVIALQGIGQAQSRWGRERGRSLMEQMAVELVLAGLKDPEALRRYSDLVGSVDVHESTASYDWTGRRASTGDQMRERSIMRADEIRRIPDGQALLVYKNAPAMLLQLTPWFERAGAKQLRKAAAETAAARAAHHQAVTEQARRAIEEVKAS